MYVNILRNYGDVDILYNIEKRRYLKLDKFESLVLRKLSIKDHSYETLKDEVKDLLSLEQLNKTLSNLNKNNIIKDFKFNGTNISKRHSNKKVNYPLKVFLDVTNACNAKCIHCFMNSGKKLNSELTYNELCNIVDEMLSIGIMKLSIGGGEPFLRSDIVDFLKYADNKYMAISLTTNGSLIDEKIAEELLKLNLKSITISLDSATNATFEKIRRGLDFNNVLNTIQLLTKNKTKYKSDTEINIRTSVNRLNKKEVDEIYNMCEDLSIDTLKLNNTNAYGRAIDNPEILLSEEEFKQVLTSIVNISDIGKCRVEMPIEKYFADKNTYKKLIGCTSTIDFINILADGKVVPCAFSFGKIIFDNIKDKSLEDILEESLPFDFNNEICNRCKANSYKGQNVISKPKYIV